MKKILLAFSLSILTIAQLVAQDKTPVSAEKKLSTYEPGDRAQSVYFELLGAGLTYSFNYDSRFQNTLNGLGGRVGVSYLSADGNSIFTAPIMLNYLLGKHGKYFEMGVGATFVNFDSNKANNSNNEILFVESSGVYGNMVFGYRKQPVDGGFMFRAGISPIFNANNFLPYYGYISLGYSF